MIRRLFERKASREAEILAEAQALLDDGLELDFVLDLFPDEAEWLGSLLTVSRDISEAVAAEAPSYYFEASLKSKFVNGALRDEPAAPMVVAQPSYSPFRTAVASMSVASAAAAIGVLSLGFVTAGDSVPGDWNYTFKLANERLEYTFSRGDGRVDVQLRQAEQRAMEIKKLSTRGDVSAEQIQQLQREIEALRALAREKELDNVQIAEFANLRNTTSTVLTGVVQKQPELAPRAAAAVQASDEAVSAALGGGAAVTTLPELTPTPAATLSPTSSATTPPPTATGTPTPPPATQTATPSATATETETASPTATATPEPGVTSTQQPAEETATASPRATP